MPARHHPFVALVDRLHHEHPELSDPEHAIAAGVVRVDGVIVTNPRGLVRRNGSITITPGRIPRGARKLGAALDAFSVPIRDAVVADIGASTGGFTMALLARGARRVYAVDAGFGQLLGRLRQDPRVVNLERTNLGDLGSSTIGEPIDVMTIDVSYLALARAMPQLAQVACRPGGHLLALVKPMYELALPAPPRDAVRLPAAVAHAVAGIEGNGWSVVATMRSPLAGRGGAIEFFVHARRTG
jgi:23S rRNA (cytidine1920-2'-O)/16S rRNA (cytidine1409-2'-O)-methyltransferase